MYAHKLESCVSHSLALKIKECVCVCVCVCERERESCSVLLGESERDYSFENKTQAFHSTSFES